MIWLVIGVALWAYSHLMKRVTPGFRASLRDGPGKGVAAEQPVALEDVTQKA